MSVKRLPKILIFIACCLFVVACQPSTEVVGGKVQTLLQQKLDATFGSGGVTVSNVITVREAENKYQGVANILAFGTSMTFKLSILADGSNVIYETAAPDWAELLATINQQKVKAADGKYADVVVANEILFSCFPDVLKRDKPKLAERLATVTPVKLEGNYWFGSGCKAHECGTEEAAWVIDREHAKGYAIILTNGVAGLTFSSYGAEPGKLPLPLLSWAIENGMNGSNSVEIRPEQNVSK